MTRLVIIGNGSTGVDQGGRPHVNRHTAEFLEDVCSLTDRVYFIQPATVHVSDSNLHDSLAPDSCTVLSFNARWRVRFFLEMVRVLGTILRADLVYIFYPGTFPEIVARICRIIRKPYAIYLRGDPRVARWFSKSSLQAAKFVTAVSTHLACASGARVERTTRIRPMIQMDERDFYRRDIRSRKQGPWRLLFVGRVEIAKGIHELLDSASLLKTKGFPFQLTVVGGGPLLKEAKEKAAAIADFPVRFTGPISEHAKLQRLYESHDVFVLPTHHEGFPRVLYEAMIKSMVIVTTPVGGIPEIMTDDVNCVFVASCDASGLAASLSQLCRDQERMQRLAEAGSSTVLDVLQRFPRHIQAFKERVDAYI